ncbi:transcriptional regulator, MarR family [Enhydrobacter aerosaccus]|uniref:Transcriptional regulator, MarR family n=1 Tax=Enhydrobacter aerosaccus TaxID=225324 RepID=A0A1T4SVS7_9HYPH|nr:MarR family transcriptional regulator [Enhydrobacter aerosaccus]SKA32385.1 transcriptional regulator, MarR family [Enhydrobacter aerosaccus]
MAQAPTKARAAQQYDVANRLFFRLYQASNLMHKQGTRYVDAFGATTQQWAVIGALARPAVLDAGVTVKSLIEFLGVSRQNLAILLNRLDERQWIERIKDKADGRSRRIRLTAVGKSVWAAMQAPIEAFYGAALADLSIDEQVMLYRLLDRLKTGLAKA